MSELNLRMEGFARQQLALGKGAWWVVDELARIGHADRAAAKALVERVYPEIRRNLILRRRPFLRVGGLMMATGLLAFGLMVPRRFDYFGAFMGFVAILIGAFLITYGWPGLRRSPGPGIQGPVRLGLTLRAEPFEKV